VVVDVGPGAGVGVEVIPGIGVAVGGRGVAVGGRGVGVGVAIGEENEVLQLV